MEIEGLTITTLVGKDGRVTIPIKLREELGIKEGDVLKFAYVPNGNGIPVFTVLVIK